jgi:hypothetical protein
MIMLEYIIAFTALKGEKYCSTISFAMTPIWENIDSILAIEQVIE